MVGQKTEAGSEWNERVEPYEEWTEVGVDKDRDG